MAILRHIIEKTIANKLKNFTSSILHTVKKCPVYLHLPWLGTPYVRLESKTKASVEKSFFAVEPRVGFTPCIIFPANKRTCFLLVYNFSCHCDSRYLGRTSQRLQD